MKHINAAISALYMGRRLCLFIAVVCINLGSAMAGNADRDTSGYTGFVAELREYIPNNVIIQLLSKLPDGGSVYGYDIGDLTANGRPDLVVSLKKPKARWNDVFIYFFTTQDAGFELIKVLTRRFNDEPLEVAFYIEDGTCFITDKIKDRYWQVDGYSIQKFVFRQVYRWINHPLPGGRYGIQMEWDYRTMHTVESYYKIESLSPVLTNRFFTIPSYPVGMRVPSDVPYVIHDTSAAMVLNGMSNWSGREDCSFSVFSRYDSTTLTLAAVIYDDVYSGGDSSVERDAVSFWLQCKGPEKLAYQQGAWQMSGIFAPGTLGIAVAADSSGAFTQLYATYADLGKKQVQLLDSIHSRTALLRGGARLVQCTVPRALLQPDEAESEIGFAASYRDVDRIGTRSLTSELATSQHFIEGVPFTFGRLKFIPASGSPFERDDFRMRPLLKELTNVGVLPR